MLIMQGALLFSIFVLLYIAIRQLFDALFWKALRRSKLQVLQTRTSWRNRLQRRFADHRLTRHLQDLLESLNMKPNARMFLLISLIGAMIGLSAGAYFFQNIKGMIMLSVMIAATPYIWLRMRLISRQMRSRLDFLPAVEVFYQHYLMAESKNIRHTLAGCLEERRFRVPVRIAFERLFRQLSTNRPPEDALRVFTFSLGHVWGQYFANLLRVGLLEGADISSSLQELIRDMRQAQVLDQAARNRLLEIRIANFSPPILCLLFIMVNFRLNGQQANYYYLIDAAGRNLLLNGLALMFASFVMGVLLSMRRM